MVQFFSLLIAVLYLTGCSAPSISPLVIDRSKPLLSALSSHVVKPGETLYAIAWRYGRDFRQLASINRIKSPYTIYPGQKLVLSQPVNSMGKLTKKTKIKSIKSINKRSVRAVSTAPTAVELSQWQWPVKGKITQYFDKKSIQFNGIDIQGRLGSPIRAAAAGKVVYSGSGLRGLGRLIIIKHSEKYLSAYANNRQLFVKEGDSVKVGQKIAEMGRSESNKAKLHFEIRADGKPVNPLIYLAKK